MGEPNRKKYNRTDHEKYGLNDYTSKYHGMSILKEKWLTQKYTFYKEHPEIVEAAKLRRLQEKIDEACKYIPNATAELVEISEWCWEYCDKHFKDYVPKSGSNTRMQCPSIRFVYGPMPQNYKWEIKYVTAIYIPDFHIIYHTREEWLAMKPWERNSVTIRWENEDGYEACDFRGKPIEIIWSEDKPDILKSFLAYKDFHWLSVR